MTFTDKNGITVYTEPCAIDPDGSTPFCYLCGVGVTTDQCRETGLCDACLAKEEGR